MVTPGPEIDRSRSAARIERDIETLAGSDFTLSDEAVRRYAYTEAYRNTVGYFSGALEELGFTVGFDPVGTLVARNRPAGERVFGIGSHCDSNRNGGKYDGTMGVVTALEVCRLSVEHGLDLPLQLISFLEEEGSGFGQMLLGSRIVAQRVSESELRETFRATDDGRSFWEHAEAAGFEPARWREAASILDDLTGWIEMHIEQARVLQDTGNRIGVVRAIAGYVHADVHVSGRGDHAGATPMDFRLDPTTVLAECVLELERLARAAGNGTVGTVGEVEVSPGLINAIASGVRFSLDIRGPDEDAFRGVYRDVAAFAERAATERGMSATVTERQALPATPLDGRLVAALEAAAAATGEPFMVMISGAAHDTMCVAERVPSAMVFVPCKDGISHHPAESADPEDAALAAEIMLDAIRASTPA
jgi:hydantoinase/carbamoylase family amidase